MAWGSGMHARVSHVVLAAGIALWSQHACAADCRLSSSGIRFGDTDALRPRRQSAIGMLAVSCHGNGAVAVTIGVAAQGDTPGRHALGVEPNAPEFALYLDPGHHQAWGDGNDGTALLQRQVPGDGREVQIPVYASLRVDGSSATGNLSRSLTLLFEFSDDGR